MSALGLYRGLASAVATPLVLAHDVLKGKLSKELISARRGIVAPGPYDAWFHGASVGESALATAAAMAFSNPDLSEDRRLRSYIFTSWSLVGVDWLRRRGTKFLGPGKVAVFPSPADSPQAVSRYLRRAQPKIAVFMQSELWPCMITEASSAGCQLALLDASLSDKSFKQWVTHAPSLARDMLSRFAIVTTPSEVEAEKLFRLGCRVVDIAPSLKYAVAHNFATQVENRCPWSQSTLEALRSRPVWMAASTHPGEEAIILAAHKLVRASCKDSLLILAPRHQHRCSAILREISEKVALSSKSEIPAQHHSIFLIDTIGDLPKLFGSCRAVFIGNTLFPNGRGHNFAEAAIRGCKIVHGPYMGSFALMKEQINFHSSFFEVEDTNMLAATITEIFQAQSMAQEDAQLRTRLESLAGLSRTAARTALTSILE